MKEALLILGMAAVTFSTRYPALAFFERLQPPESVFRALRFVPVAVLTAITIPVMVMPQGKIDLAFDNAYLIAGIVAIGVSWKTKKLLPTIVIGMAVFLALRFVTGQIT